MRRTLRPTLRTARLVPRLAVRDARLTERRILIQRLNMYGSSSMFDEVSSFYTVHQGVLTRLEVLKCILLT